MSSVVSADAPAVVNNHPLKLGDVVVSSWGYDQTNVDFYQVVKVTKGTVGIRRIKADCKESGFMCGHSTPRVGEFHESYPDVLTKRPNKFGVIRITSYASAGTWDGTPRYTSWYA
jgi:hypothetical protein